MQTTEWTKIWHNPQLDVELLHAYHVQHAYPRHSHDYYVISLIERGRQSFTHKGAKHFTAAGGLILINPGAVHTGEAVDGQGFEMRSLYPTTAHMQMALSELTGRHGSTPYFNEVRVDDPWAMRSVLSLHTALTHGAGALEIEARFLRTLAGLIQRYGDTSVAEQRLGNEKETIRKARAYIDEHYARGVSLNELAQHVALSPYYPLRAFSAEVGMPPYAYLESVRVRHAQRLIETGRPLSEVAIQTGYSSQSHMTRQFKNILGATPGQYAPHVAH
jgi:AraC-like DNA-binding protein